VIAPAGALREQQHRQPSGGDQHVAAAVQQWPHLAHEVRAHRGIHHAIGERPHEPRQIRGDLRHAADALRQTVTDHLLVVPRNEHRIDHHQPEPPADRAGEQHRRLAEADHRDIDGAAAFGQAGFLEMADDEGVVTAAFRLDPA
jgi:hypothetical protein